MVCVCWILLVMEKLYHLKKKRMCQCFIGERSKNLTDLLDVDVCTGTLHSVCPYLLLSADVDCNNYRKVKYPVTVIAKKYVLLIAIRDYTRNFIFFEKQRTEIKTTCSQGSHVRILTDGGGVCKNGKGREKLLLNGKSSQQTTPFQQSLHLNFDVSVLYVIQFELRQSHA